MSMPPHVKNEPAFLCKARCGCARLPPGCKLQALLSMQLFGMQLFECLCSVSMPDLAHRPLELAPLHESTASTAPAPPQPDGRGQTPTFGEHATLPGTARASGPV